MRLVSNFSWRVIAPALILLAPAAASAQTTYRWNQSTSGGSWQTASNWMPSDAAPGTVTDIALFGNAATGANSVTLTGNVSIGELRFDGVTSGSATAAYTIGTNAQTITVNNGAAGITVSGATTTNQIVAANVAAGAGQPLTIVNNGGSGVTTLTLSGALSATTAGSGLNVSGWSNTTISGAIGNSIGTLTKDGPGVLALSAANAYTGGTVINGGTIRFTDNNQLGALAGGVTLNGGALHVAADIFVDRNITLGASGGTILSTAGTGASNPTFRNPISGAGALTLDGGFYMDFTANNAYTGATIINNAGVRLAEGGRFSATTAITVNGFVGGQIGFLTLDNSIAGNVDRVNNSAAITLNGGLIAGVGSLITNNNELLGNLTLRGYGTINTTKFNGGLGTDALTFNSITRADNFSTLYVGGPVFAPASGGTYQVKFTSGLTDPGGSNQTIGIIPWIGGDRGRLDASQTAIIPTNYAATLYTFNTTDGLVALDSSSNLNFFQVSAGAAFNGPVPGAKNNAITNDPAAVNSSITILSLVQNPTSGISTITGTGTVTVSTGAIANINTMVFNGPTLNFNSATGYIWLGHDFVVSGSSRITGTNGLVLSSNSDDGRNTLYLLNTSTPNSFTGGLYLNGTSRVAFDTADSQLGAAGEKIAFRGGTLRYIGTGPVSLSTGGTDRPLEMSAAGGGIIRVEEAGGTLTVPGVISGSEQLTVLGPGTLVLSNTANTYAGGTSIGNATVAIAGAGSLGTGSVNLGARIGAANFSGGTLRFDFSGAVAANFNHDLSSTLNTNGNTVTLSGVISGGGATLTKAGAGTLTLTGANTYAGNTTVNAGTLLVANTSGSGTGAGRVTVNTGATLGGTGAVAGAVAVNSGGTLQAGGVGGLGQLTLRGKTTLASGSSFATTLAGTTAGTQYGQLVISAGGSIDLGSATLAPTLSYTPSNTDKLFLIDNQNASGGLTGTFATLVQGATYTFGNGTTAVISYTGDFATGQLVGGNDVVLHAFNPVPEPATVLGLAALALGGGAMWRRKRAGAAV